MIEMGEQYKTRDGRKVRVLCVDRRASLPVVGLIDYGTHEEQGSWNADGTYHRSGSWNADGTYCRSGDFPSGSDLVEISPYEGWPIDAPVWVRDDRCQAWRPGHFAGIAEGSGNPLAYADGCTSHTAKRGSFLWREVRLASEFTPSAEERGDD